MRTIDKQYYKNVPVVDGFKWSFYDDVKDAHCFIKGSDRTGYIAIYCNDDDIVSGSHLRMMERGYTR